MERLVECGTASAASAPVGPPRWPSWPSWPSWSSWLERAQTFFWYERNVTTDTATHTTARTSNPPQRTPIAPQSG
jgi:hypothetical protein